MNPMATDNDLIAELQEKANLRWQEEHPVQPARAGVGVNNTCPHCNRRYRSFGPAPCPYCGKEKDGN